MHRFRTSHEPQGHSLVVFDPGYRFFILLIIPLAGGLQDVTLRTLVLIFWGCSGTAPHSTPALERDDFGNFRVSYDRVNVL